MTSSPGIFPVYNFDIQKKHKSSNIHVSLALSPNPSSSHHQDYYLFIYTCEVENSSKLSLVTITGKGGQPKILYQLDKFKVLPTRAEEMCGKIVGGILPKMALIGKPAWMSQQVGING